MDDVDDVVLPPAIGRLGDRLAEVRGVVAVVLGGSRARRSEDDASDWDLGVYYRSGLDVTRLERVVAPHGELHPPGRWGRLMDGGAWLHVDGAKVDVLLRDVAVVEHWTAEAAAGRYEVDGVLGYLAGVPTYSLTAEAAGALPIRGALDVPTAFPDALAEAAPTRWRIHRDFSLDHAGAHAARGNVPGVLGQAARAVFEEAHARACEQRRWVLNEKRLLDGAELDAAAAALRGDVDDPCRLVQRLRRSLA